jgi:hypothetical protein
MAAHRLLGDGCGTAMVAYDGTIDWWCAPAFDAPPLLWSLLDPAGAASAWIGATYVEAPSRPAGPTSRSVVRVDGRRVILRDGLVPSEDGTCLVRLARLEDGPPLRATHRLALGGFDRPWAASTNGELTLDGVKLDLVADGEVTGGRPWLSLDVWLTTDRWVGMVIGVDASVPWSAPADAAGALDDLDAEARVLLRSARFPRHHPERAADALAVLRACTDRRTGAVVASPTTSLPEAVGHDRQFDYRYCWIRDAALATSVAALLGDPAAAQRYLAFVAEVALPDPDACPPVVRTDGGRVPAEREVADVRGWADSAPVRVGNAAAEQVQYDAWGFVLEAVLVNLHAGGRLDASTWQLVRAVADRMADHEPEAESGIWELRRPKQLLSADIGRWLVLDRAVRIARWHRPWHPRRRWARARDATRAAVLAALHADGRLPQAHDDDRPDASALTVVLFGLLPPSDARAHHVVDAVLRDLGEGPHVRRYPPGDDGFGGVDGTFLPISWWAVSSLALLGRLDEAEARADELCAGLPQLLPEMVDPPSGMALGNTPLVWSHMELARAMDWLDAGRTVRRFGRAGLVARRFVRSVPYRVGLRR